ncbi:unnamed protein product, partial [Musa acuminata subsp. burmannicoides]
VPLGIRPVVGRLRHVPRTNSSTGRQCEFEDWAWRSNIHVLFIHQGTNSYIWDRARSKIGHVRRSMSSSGRNPNAFWSGPFLHR